MQSASFPPGFPVLIWSLFDDMRALYSVSLFMAVYISVVCDVLLGVIIWNLILVLVWRYPFSEFPFWDLPFLAVPSQDHVRSEWKEWVYLSSRFGWFDHWLWWCISDYDGVLVIVMVYYVTKVLPWECWCFTSQNTALLPTVSLYSVRWGSSSFPRNYFLFYLTVSRFFYRFVFLQERERRREGET